MAKVIISLLGGRPVSNVLSALHLKPDHFYIVVSEDSLGTNGNYEKVISALPDQLKPSAPHSVKPYVLAETIQVCETIFEQHKEDQIIVVSASEPKTMGFGAYDFVRRLKVDGRDIDMCYLSREGLIWIFRAENSVEPVEISLKDYFASYGWNIISRAKEENPKFQQLVSLLIGNLPTSHHLLSVLRNSDKGKGKRTIKHNRRLNDEEFFVLQEIEKLQIISNVRRTDTETVWTINSEEDAKFLLTGDWLEFGVWQYATVLATPHPLFSECGWGVEDQTGKGEIDFAGIVGGQVIIASCKTEDKIKRTWFEELHSKVEQLGKGMCSAILISSVSKESREESELQKYEKWANERQITLVMAEDIPKIPDVVKKIALGDKNAEPKHISCYARI